MYRYYNTYLFPIGMMTASLQHLVYQLDTRFKMFIRLSQKSNWSYIKINLDKHIIGSRPWAGVFCQIL